VSFVNPVTRDKVCAKKILAEITGRKGEQLMVNAHPKRSFVIYNESYSVFDKG